jgi:hypothetical protein
LTSQTSGELTLWDDDGGAFARGRLVRWYDINHGWRFGRIEAVVSSRKVRVRHRGKLVTLPANKIKAWSKR